MMNMDLSIGGLVGDLDRNRAFTIEALRFALLSANLSFEKVRQGAYGMEAGSNQPTLGEGFAILSSCWAVVDAMDRAEELSRHVKGLRRTTEVRLFRATASRAKAFRNYFQHLPTEIPSLPTSAQPTMGSLSWISPHDAMKSTTVWISTGGEQASIYGLAFDTHKVSFVGDFVFSAAAKDLRLDELTSAAANFLLYFDDWLRSSSLLADKSIACSKFTFEIQTEKSHP